MNVLERQRGMTMLGWLMMLAIIGFLSLITLKILPAYMQYFSVLNSVKSVAEQSTAETPIAEIRRGIDRRFTVNSITDVRANDIGYVREDNKIFLHIDYEVRTSMLGNVDVVVVFDRKLEVGPR